MKAHPALADPLISIDHVVDGVYISGWRATRFEPHLLRAGLTRVLKLYASAPYFSAAFTTLENICNDGELLQSGLLERSVAFIRSQVEADQPVLVMCGAGISRSSTMVLAYMVDQGYDLRDAYYMLKQAHPAAAPHPAMWQSLLTFYKLGYPLADVVHWAIEFKPS